MAWVAVDKDGTELIFNNEPSREDYVWVDPHWEEFIKLPKGTIKKLIGRELTWNDEPVELK